MKKTVVALLCFVAFSSAPALAQPSFELTPFLGWRFGGGFDYTVTNVNVANNFDIKNDLNYGLIANIGFHEYFQLELLWDSQSSEINPKDPIAGLDMQPQLDLKIDYYHVGFVFPYPQGQLVPFSLFSLGVTTFYPEGDLDNETKFSLGGALGIKYFVNDRMGFRLQSRLMATSLGSDADVWCDPFGCWTFETRNWVTQVDVSAGIILKVN